MEKVWARNIKGKIRKVAQTPPKFDVHNKRNSCAMHKGDLEEDRAHEELQCMMQISLEEAHVCMKRYNMHTNIIGGSPHA
jgi:hypothetical protein